MKRMTLTRELNWAQKEIYDPEERGDVIDSED